MIAIRCFIWQRATLALCLWAPSYSAHALQYAQADLAWEQIRPGLLYARQDIPIEGSDTVHRLHWLRLSLTQPELHVGLTPHPRSAIGLDASRQTMVWVAAEGRQHPARHGLGSGVPAPTGTQQQLLTHPQTLCFQNLTTLGRQFRQGQRW